MARVAIVLLVIVSPIILSSCVTKRPINEFVRPDKVVVKCAEPPADIILKSGDAKVNTAMKGIGELIRAEGSDQRGREWYIEDVVFTSMPSSLKANPSCLTH